MGWDSVALQVVGPEDLFSGLSSVASCVGVTESGLMKKGLWPMTRVDGQGFGGRVADLRQRNTCCIE